MKRRQFIIGSIALAGAATVPLYAAPLGLIPTAGVPNPPVGDITILAERTTLRVAPDSVRLSVDLSASDFDTPTTNPGSNSAYNPQHHDLIYMWDCDADNPGLQWTAPVNTLPEWKLKNIASGPWIAHVYDSAGDKRISLTVYEPSSGKSASTELIINVADPDVVYAGADTICINPFGDNNFTEAPAGAQEVNAAAGNVFNSSSSGWTSNNGGNPKRFLWKRGATYDTTLNFSQSMTAGLMVGAYGTGEKPIWSHNQAGGMYILVQRNYGVVGSPADFRWSNTRVVSTYNPATGGGEAMSRGMLAFSVTDAVLSNCEFDGIGGAVVEPSSHTVTAENHFHMDNCALTTIGGQYPFISPYFSHANTSISVTGSAVIRDQLSDCTNGGMRACVRINQSAFAHIRGCDLYNTQENQPALKLQNRPSEGTLNNVHSNSIEAMGLWCISAGTNYGGTTGSQAANFIIDGNVMVTGWDSQMHFHTTFQGVTVRNNLMITPDVKRTVQAVAAFTNFEKLSATSSSAPIKVYDNTGVCLRRAADNYNLIPVMVRLNDRGDGIFSDVTDNNNIRYMPEMGITDATNLDDKTNLWQSRNIGRYTTSLDVSYATPPDSISPYN